MDVEKLCLFHAEFRDLTPDQMGGTYIEMSEQTDLRLQRRTGLMFPNGASCAEMVQKMQLPVIVQTLRPIVYVWRCDFVSSLDLVQHEGSRGGVGL